MKLRIRFLAPLALAALLFGSFCGPSKSHAATNIQIGLYYDQLDPYGDWYYVGSYGWVWSPGYVSAGWRPYTVGYWVYSDWGWVWVSEDPWGDWPYHYGRWAFDASYGYIWVPGDIWAPAWVSWRYSSGYVGWAPLPPDVGWSIGVGIQYSSSYIDRRISSDSWCFVGVNDFASRRVRGRVLPVGQNVTLIRETRNVTKYVEVGSRPVERGLRPDLIERAAGKQIPRYDITERSVQGRGGVQVRGRTIQVSKPTRGAVRAANAKLRALPKERAERRPTRTIREDRQNENTSRRQSNVRGSERQRQERDAEVRTQRSVEPRERRAVQDRSRRDENLRSQQMQERRQQAQERRQQAQERRSQQTQEPRQQQAQEGRQQAQERRSQQAQEPRSQQGQERRQQAQQQRRDQDRRSQQAQEQRRKQRQEQERRGRGGGGT